MLLTYLYFDGLSEPYFQFNTVKYTTLVTNRNIMVTLLDNRDK